MRIPNIFAIFFTVIVTSTAGAQENLQWEQSLDAALAKAQAMNRPVFVEFTAPWCGVCRKMNQEVLSRTDVESRIARSFVPAKVNVDHYPNVGKEFGITGLPTIAVVAPDGKCLEMHRGALSSEQLLGKISRYETRYELAAAPAYRQSNVPSHGNPISREHSPQATAAGNPPFAPAGNPTSVPQGRYGNPYEGPYEQRSISPQPSETAPAKQSGPASMDAGPSGPNNTPSVRPEAYGSRRPDVPDYDRSMSTDYRSSPHYQAEGTRYNAPRPHYGDPNRVVPEEPTHPGQPFQPSTPPSFPSNPANRPGPQAPLGNQDTVSSATEPTFAMEGYCPVTLVESRAWKMGDRQWGARHEGRVYLFVGPDEQRRFLADPNRFSPVFAGMDIVLFVDGGQRQAGTREHGVFFADRIYLFSSEESLQRFTNKPHHYTATLSQGLGRKADLPPRTTYR